MKSISTLLEKNQNIKLKPFNLSDKIAIQKLNLTVGQETEELSQLMGYQRLLRLTDCKQTSQKLFDKGFHSVFNITELAQSQFVKMHAENCIPNGSCSPKQFAAQIYQKALSRKNQLVQTYIGIQQHNSAHYKAGRFDNLSAATAGNFNGVPSYENLFDGLDFCSCPECRTIFSPAAYFVDLMSKQEKYIDRSQLKVRRPDLEKIELSCKNTHTLIPTVSIVNEVLAQSIDKKGEGYKELSKANYPFNLPYNLPFTEINTSLDKEGLNLAEVWKNLTPQEQIDGSAEIQKSIQLATIGISPEMWSEISKLDEEIDLGKVYGLTNRDSVSDLSDVELFLKQTGLSFVQLRKLVYQDLGEGKFEWEDENIEDHEGTPTYEIPKTFYINIGEGLPIELGTKNDKTIDGEITKVAVLENTTDDRLRHINRFVRLAQSIGWSFADLDWALQTIALILNPEDPKTFTVLDGDLALPYLAWIQTTIATNPNSKMVEVCALQGILKQFGTEGTDSFLKQVFFNENIPNKDVLEPTYSDGQKILKGLDTVDGEKGCWKVPEMEPPNTVDFLKLKAGNSEEILKPFQLQTALATALKMNVDDLLYTADAMLAGRGISDRILPINAETLGILYRCSKLSQLYGLSFKEVMVAITLIDPENSDITSLNSGVNKVVSKATDALQPLLEALVQFADWTKKSSMSVYGLEYLITGKSLQASINNQIVSEEPVKNFYNGFQETIDNTFLTKEKFNQELGDILDRNQYSEKAQEFVYYKIGDEILKINKLIKKALSDLGSFYLDHKDEIEAAINYALDNLPWADIQNILEHILKKIDAIIDDLDSSQKTKLINIITQLVTKRITKLVSKAFIKPIVEKIFPTYNDELLEVQKANLANFISGYLLESGLGSEVSFVEKTKESFVKTMSSDYLPNALWTNLSTDPKYINVQAGEEKALSVQKVTGDDQKTELSERLKPLLFGSRLPAEDILNLQLFADFSTSNASVLTVYYETQQYTFQQEVATFYDLSEDVFNPFLSSIPVYLNEGSYQPLQLIDLIGNIWGVLSEAKKKDLLNAFQNLQVYAELIKAMSLSAAETASMKAHPVVYGIMPSPQVPFFLTIDNILSLLSLKDMQLALKDNQNLLINYLNGIKEFTGEKVQDGARKKESAKNLSKLTQWDEKQIHFLLDNLLFTAGPEPWRTVDGVNLLSQWFKKSEILHLDVSTLWLVNNVANGHTDYEYNQQAADVLWAGLAQKYDTDNLRSLRATIDVTTRNALAPLVLHTLGNKNGLILNTYRDLSNYLLIDVEVGAEVETSKIGSAISTVQMYVYRCINSLEKGIEIEEEFENWWEWMANYRVWEANRKVFLFPENYIEPELRTDKTPEFTQLETDLQAANLKNPAEIETVFNTYMNAFSEVADLEVIGSAGYDYDRGDVTFEEYDSKTDKLEDVTKDVLTKVFCLVGRTKYEPYQYYYRLVTFAQGVNETGEYVPVKWEPWHKINTPIQAIGPVKPVFGMGKWFITWVEQQQTGSKTEVVDEKEKEVPTYTAFCKLSFLNFNKEWVAPKTIGKVPLPIALEEFEQEKEYWNQVYPSFFNSIQLLIVTYGKDGNELPYSFKYSGDKTLTNALKYAARYVAPNQLYTSPFNAQVKGSGEYQYWSGGLPRSIDAALNDGNTVYFFKGVLFYTCKWDEREIVGPPQKIADVFDGIERVTGAVNVGESDFYLFNGEEYSRLAWSDKKKTSINYPVNVDTGSETMPGTGFGKFVAHPIQAAINLKKNTDTYIYLFSEQVYSRLNNNAQNPGKDPSNIENNWKGLGDSFDAALQDPKSPEIAYFFKGIDCKKYNNQENTSESSFNLLAQFHPTNSIHLVPSNNTSIHLSLWVYITVNTSTLCKIEDEAGTTYSLEKGSDGYISFVQNNASNTLSVAKTNILRPEDNKWCYVSLELIYDKSGAIKKIEVCINGELHETTPSHFIGNSLDFSLTNKNIMQEEIILTTNNRFMGGEEMYNNSKKYINRGYEKVINDIIDVNTELNINTFPNRVVVGQPGWQTFSKDGIELLTGLQKHKNGNTVLSCYRLNTTAINTLSQTLYMQGINGLLSIPSQETTEIPFKILGLDANVDTPSNQIDFNGGAMSQYYWEIFFYMPFLIAKSLQTQQQNSAAQKWYEYIFNPTINKKDEVFSADTENDKYWRFLGLRSSENPILNEELNESWADEVEQDTKNAVQLYAYHNDPFNPHAIARLRPIAYQKTMVMHYIDNLLSGGDKLFRQYTVESIVEASMLYMMAYDLLGNEPIDLGTCKLPKVTTIKELNSNNEFLIEEKSSETAFHFILQLEQVLAQPRTVLKTIEAPYNGIDGIYFGLPENDEFLRYWDTVKERLYNIRHGLNIEGVRQHLALFQPAIDPMKLVEQLANGGSVSGALAALQTSVPYYRFSVMIQLAKNTTQTVMQFGQSLLAALEKKDAEQLSLMYNQNQLNLLQQTTGSKQAQVDALEETLQSLDKSKEGADQRYQYYDGLIEKGLSSDEKSQLTGLTGAIAETYIGMAYKTIAIGAYLTPTVFGMANGNFNPGSSFDEVGSVADEAASILSTNSSIVGTKGSYERRTQEWEQQKTLAEIDKEQIEHQIEGTKYQIEAAKGEVKLLKKNIDQEQKIQQFLKNKFTNKQLYQWMVGKLSAAYFQAYQLAYNMSLQAQEAWKFEKGVENVSYIKGGYWDGLHEGLLAGEGLMLNLVQMENAFMQRNKRRFEITKIISLKSLDNDDNIMKNLKDGECIFEFSQEMFNNDYSSHYCRQIASISIKFITLNDSCQNIHATLTQLRNTTQLKPKVDVNKSVDPKECRVDWQINQQIALSQRVNNTGMFTFNFNDERYLPFEGTGAISAWKLEMNTGNESQEMVLENLTDVIIELNYTAL